MAPAQAALEALAAALGGALVARRETLATAESCTGGWVAMCLTAVAGSSTWFERGLVTYSNDAKHELLGVPAATLNRHGAVSEATVRAMATGLLERTPVDWALSISGVAGPGGGSPDKPVGTVWFGLARRGQGPALATRCCFAGDRAAVRAQAVAFALESLVMAVSKPPSGGWPAVP